MDVDMDIDLGLIDGVEALPPVSIPIGAQNKELCLLNSQSTDLIVQSNGADGVEAIQTTTIADPENTTPHKVHIRGVDDLTTDDIKALSIEHFPSDSPTRIEWIDDTSANIVYSTPGAGLTALDHLSLQSSTTAQITELRMAKTLSSRPDSILQVRTALTSDQKRPRAHEASRFYMMHPEHDPREQRRRDKSYHSNGDYRRLRYGDNEDKRRRRRNKEEGFDASMYDDGDTHSSRRGSLASSPEGRTQRAIDSYRTRRNGVNEIRDRSASPDRQSGDGSRRRNRTPPPAYRTRDPHPFPTQNEGKELFPAKAKRDSENVGKDLFSDRLLAAGSTKELFPHKTNTILHRRSDAFDAADETADLFANGMSVPFTDGVDRGATKSLASRITAPYESTYGRLKGSDPELSMDSSSDKNDAAGLNIRGASRKDQGFSIRGSAAGTIKDLFPNKATGNAGKELFAEKLEGRGARRTRAEDMFY